MNLLIAVICSTRSVPPAGYDVDVAIGTTYSLDLMALLAVPLAFALFDWEDDSGKVNADPLALLEAARRYARKTHIFCQSGQIHLPKQRSPLFYELERVVKEGCGRPMTGESFTQKSGF